ncbi:MAG: hypothetical protein ACOCPN_04550 [Desulfonatronovibrionaceae bacterium]
MPCRILVLMLMLFITGCAAFQKDTPSDPEQNTRIQPLDDPPLKDPPLKDPPETEISSQIYYDFEDIPVPPEMELKAKDSILFESRNIKAGMLSFRGRVDSESLFNYFQVMMPEEGWRLLSYIRYGSYIQTFDKKDRLCIVRIISKSFTSELQIWISPKLDTEQ